MKIKIIFDKETKSKSLHTGWGVSFLIGEKILFDTGERGDWLIENMKSLKVDIDKIKTVVISHDHWDHTGGLWDLLEKKKGLIVYACPNFSPEFKKKVVGLKGKLMETKKVAEIERDIFVTGEIEGEYGGQYMPEQALALKTKNGLTLVTGCAHPGVLKIVTKIRDRFVSDPVYFVFGGFHLTGQDKRAIEIVTEGFKQRGVQKAGPTHCSGTEAEKIFKDKYGKDFIPINVGETLDV